MGNTMRLVRNTAQVVKRTVKTPYILIILGGLFMVGGLVFIAIRNM
jgi:hypothetical protein